MHAVVPHGAEVRVVVLRNLTLDLQTRLQNISTRNCGETSEYLGAENSGEFAGRIFGKVEPADRRTEE